MFIREEEDFNERSMEAFEVVRVAGSVRAVSGRRCESAGSASTSTGRGADQGQF